MASLKTKTSRLLETRLFAFFVEFLTFQALRLGDANVVEFQMTKSTQTAGVGLENDSSNEITSFITAKRICSFSLLSLIN